MLRRISVLAVAVMIGYTALVHCQVSFADECTPNSWGDFENNTVGVGVDPPTCPAGNAGSGGSPQSGSGQSGSNGYTPQEIPNVCYNAAGKTVDCWMGDYKWNPTFQFWCKVADDAYRDAVRDEHKDENGNYIGIMYRCTNHSTGALLSDLPFWVDDSEFTAVPVDAEAIAQQVVATLELHPPTIGVGAYIYPDKREYGLSWWIGAPMWLWIDRYDSLQWGTHTLTATQSGVTVTATIKSLKVTYDTGDGSTQVCANPGVPRLFDKDKPAREHSPGCDFTYLTRNAHDDPTSRYTVSAKVTWQTTWTATNNQSGKFTFDVASTNSPSVHIGELYTVDQNLPRPR